MSKEKDKLNIKNKENQNDNKDIIKSYSLFGYNSPILNNISYDIKKLIKLKEINYLF